MVWVDEPGLLHELDTRTVGEKGPFLAGFEINTGSVRLLIRLVGQAALS